MSEKCYRITPSDIPWSEENGLAGRELFQSDVVQLRAMKLPPSITWPIPSNTLSLITQGMLTSESTGPLCPGDLYWCNSDATACTTGSEGAILYCITPLQSIGQDMATQAVLSADIEWEQFDDPAGRPTQPVQVLLQGSISALRTRFDPDYIAGEHWHDFDTLYFISDGRMQFGDEGWFDQGDIRAVHGGHSYGPERPGSEGVEFVLISLGGPVALHWSDLEPPP